MWRKGYFKLIVIGDSGVGKTSLVVRYVLQTFAKDFRPTVGFDFLQKEINIKGEKVALQLWDPSGGERFSPLGSMFYRAVDACAIIYDIANLESFERVDKWKDNYIQYYPPEDSPPPLVLIGNKIDREDERQVPVEKAQAWCKGNGDIPFFEVSAKEDWMVEEAFQVLSELAYDVVDNKTKLSLLQDTSTRIVLENQPIDANKQHQCAC